MERQVDDPMFLSSIVSKPSPSQPQLSNHFNFGGIRHGFNTPNSNRRYPYPPPTPCFQAPMNLPSLTSLLSNEFSTGPAPRAPLYPTNMNDSGMRRIQSLEGNAMMTPLPSRRTSEMHGVEPTVKESTVSTGLYGLYGCGDNATIEAHETPNIQIATAACNRMQPYSRVSVSQLLNTPVENSGLTSMASQCPGESRGISPDTSSTQRRQSPVRMSICSDTTNSSLTIRPSLDIAEERCFLLSTLYQTCQTATAEYIHSLPLTRRVRAVSHYHPYKTRCITAASRKGKKSNPTLMDSIARICTRIWRKARRDLVAPHREESNAVKEMRDLYKWSEVVARSRESDGLDEGGEGSDVSGTEGGRSDGLGFPGMRVAKAAKKICRWLGDEEAFNDCDTVMAELRELAEYDARGSLADQGRGGDSENGSIL